MIGPSLPKSSINLYGKHAFATKNMPLGVKKNINVTIQKTSHSIDSQDGTESARFDIIGIKPPKAIKSDYQKKQSFNIYKKGKNNNVSKDDGDY